ncbi:hypothetical protein TNIN_292701 [Trichonephila inaurata madagascariensis]|uniref:Uncharacterized protein n=1 Tax=Trichonephila inaurata madagascariensis TaxID=2747483 RepID=A0A8X7CUD9_9ARAC|nr:hypothetical protein TNIN_292701 [Trichonephila inaurata madagascariensis]
MDFFPLSPHLRHRERYCSHTVRRAHLEKKNTFGGQIICNEKEKCLLKTDHGHDETIFYPLAWNEFQDVGTLQQAVVILLSLNPDCSFMSPPKIKDLPALELIDYSFSFKRSASTEFIKYSASLLSINENNETITLLVSYDLPVADLPKKALNLEDLQKIKIIIFTPSNSDNSKQHQLHFPTPASTVEKTSVVLLASEWKVLSATVKHVVFSVE